MRKAILLTSSRIRMRSIKEGDATLLKDFEFANIEHFSRYAPMQEKKMDSIAYWEKKVLEYMQEFNNGTSVRFLLFDKNSLKESIVGVCNFTQIFRGAFQACYLGYKIDKLHEGKGLMFEALSVACAYMFQEENLHRIMANYIPSNSRSEKLLKLLGFEKEGYAKEYLFINGIWEDHILTSLTNHLWKEEG